MSSKPRPPERQKVRGNKSAGALSGISKPVTGCDMLAHMGDELRLMRDHLAAQRFHLVELGKFQIKKLRKEMGLADLPAELSEEAEFPEENDGRSMVFDEKTNLMATGDQIVGLRIYKKGVPPKDVPVSEGKEWIAYNLGVLKERSTYREINGQIVTMGQPCMTRKTSRKAGEEVRLGASPLRTMSVRLMPHEARAAGKSLTNDQLGRAMDRTVAKLEKALDCEVVSAAVHRMRDGDLHIHLQYTMVQAVHKTREQLLQKKISDWVTEASDAARALLIAEGRAVGPYTIGKRKDELFEAGGLPPKPTIDSVDEVHVRWVKKRGRRNLKNNAILGYSFKFKLNLVREVAAFQRVNPGQAKELESLKQAVAAKFDGPDRKFQKMTEVADSTLGKEFIDLWLERQWRAAVVRELPEDEKAKLPAAALAEARDYEQNGTTRSKLRVYLDAHNKDVADRLQQAAQSVEKTEQHINEIEQRISAEIEKMQALATAATAAMDHAFADLGKIRDRLAGPESPATEVSTVAELVEEIGVIIERKAETVVAGHLKEAFVALFPDQDPPEAEDPQILGHQLAEKLSEKGDSLGLLTEEAKATNAHTIVLQKEIVDLKGAAETDRKATAAALTAAQNAELTAKMNLAPVLERERVVEKREGEIAGREAVVKSAEIGLAKRENRLAGWAKSLKGRLRQWHAGRVSKAIKRVTAGVLGDRLAKKLFEAGEDPRLMVRDEVARLRRAEKVLAELVKSPSKAAPDSAAGKLLARAKSILVVNQTARTPKVAPEKPKKDSQPGI